MSKLLEDTLGIPNIIWISGAIGGSAILVAVAIRSLFASDVSLQVLNAKYEISTSKLELAKSAQNIQKSAYDTSSLIDQLKLANEAYKLTNDRYQACRTDLSNYQIPTADKDLKIDPPIPIISEIEIKKAEKEIEQSKKDLSHEIDEIFAPENL